MILSESENKIGKSNLSKSKNSFAFLLKKQIFKYPEIHKDYGDKMAVNEKYENVIKIKDEIVIPFSRNLDVVFYKGPEPSHELLEKIRKVNPSVSGIWKNAVFYKDLEPYELLLKQQRDTTKRDTTKFVMAISAETPPEVIITTIVNAVKNNPDASYFVAISYDSDRQVEKGYIITGIMERLGLKENEVLENLKRQTNG